MLQVERLHLKHVLQTVSVLEAVVLRSFGPDGGQVLFTRDTGQVMLSRSGTRILTALRLEHPLARMVVECVWKHSAVTGDGSKTFLLLLASLLRVIHTAARKEPNVSHNYNTREAVEAATARRLADELLAFGLEELGDVITLGVVPYGGILSWEDATADTQVPAHINTETRNVQNLLAAFFHTRLGRTHCDFVSRLTCELLSHLKCHDDPPSLSLHFIDDNFPALHTPVSGFPISCSRLIEGQVIHRDFSTPHPQTDHQLIKAVVFSGHLQPNVLSAGAVLEVGGIEMEKGEKERSIVRYSAWTERSLECVIATLQSLGVSLLLSAVKQSEAVLALAGLAEMCVVECVSEDELSLFAQLSGAAPVSDCWLIGQEHVATLTFCQPILLGAHRYVHVDFHMSEERVTVKPYSLVVCGPGEGQTDQFARAFRDALRMLLTTCEPTHMTATAAVKSNLNSHESKSLHVDKHTDKTTHALTSEPPSQKCVLEPVCVVPVGGTFEFLLHRALVQHGCTRSASDLHTQSHTATGSPALCRLLAEALLSVPQQIYSHSPRRFLQTKTLVLSYMQTYGRPLSLIHKHKHNRSPVHNHGKGNVPLEDSELLNCCGEVDVLPEVSVLESGLESVSCKYQLILAVLQCVSSLLRVDAVLRTHTPLHAQPRGYSNSSLEDREEKDED